MTEEGPTVCEQDMLPNIYNERMKHDQHKSAVARSKANKSNTPRASHHP
jgi:hypothetical protein